MWPSKIRKKYKSVDENRGKIIIHDKNEKYITGCREIVKPQKQEKKLCIKKIFSVKSYNSLCPEIEVRQGKELSIFVRNRVTPKFCTLKIYMALLEALFSTKTIFTILKPLPHRLNFTYTPILQFYIYSHFTILHMLPFEDFFRLTEKSRF